MFTGIVEGQGEVVDLALGPDGARLQVRAPWLDGLRVGDSVAVDGCCLTVIALEPDGFAAEVMAESLRRTALGRLGHGDQLNLERPLRVGDRLGGHMVQGHVDGLGRVLDRRRIGEIPSDSLDQGDGAQALLGGGGGSEPPPHGQRTEVPEAARDAAARVSEELRLGLDPELARYVVAKGSITVNGVSLTVVAAGPDWLTVGLIPHTMAVTNLGRLAAGDEVHLEVDVLAKYVERLLEGRLAPVGRPEGSGEPQGGAPVEQAERSRA
jgi:riboflavin synthase